jgi:hypothetical protein
MFTSPAVKGDVMFDCDPRSVYDAGTADIDHAFVVLLAITALTIRISSPELAVTPVRGIERVGPGESAASFVDTAVPTPLRPECATTA